MVTVNEVIVLMNCQILPVSTSVTLTLYSLIIPFCSLGGGGSQENVIDLELSAIPVGFIGGLVGTMAVQ